MSLRACLPMIIAGCLLMAAAPSQAAGDEERVSIRHRSRAAPVVPEDRPADAVDGLVWAGVIVGTASVVGGIGTFGTAAVFGILSSMAYSSALSPLTPAEQKFAAVQQADLLMMGAVTLGGASALLLGGGVVAAATSVGVGVSHGTFDE